ncbi:hypothetical protein QFC24_000107 [Naganishia onofrii]|uniref:Uncharacterized protein n=1 Tax=Naganishia onofrii TaxID=1851511 RepID=A0ACC2XUY1_9TREE|nr:hypothetical protein QFC24_000107 [Naganishia onofrii]
MAFPLLRPHRTSFSESIVVFETPTTTSLTGRKRTNQAAGLSDVSVEDYDDDDDEVGDNDMGHTAGMMKNSGCEKAVVGEDLRESRRISSTGRRRSSAKGARKEGESPTASSSPPKGRTIAESNVEDKAYVSLQVKELDSAPQNSTAATFHTSELANLPDGPASSLLETSSSDKTVHPSIDMQNPIGMPAITPANNSVNERTDDLSDKERSSPESELESEKVWGMPDWAAELDEVVPGVKVMSIHDAMKVLLDYHQQDTPTSVLFPWLHGIGDGPLGANGPLEQFFGNPSLTPPRYRGLCILKAPPVTAASKHSPSADNMQPLRSSSSTSKSDDDSWQGQHTALNTAESTDPASPYTPRDRAASTSTYLSTMSSATWASTDSSEPSLYSIRSSPQSVTTIGTDCGGKSSETGITPIDSMSFTEDIDRNEGNAAGQPVEVAMHPTCSKRMLGVETSSRDTASFGSVVTLAALQTSVPSSDVEMDPDVDMEEGEVELQIPPSISYDSISPAGTRTPQTSPPPTPQAPLSAHPTEENSILRTASGKGRVRSASPTPVNNAAPKCLSELLIRADSDRNGHTGREDSQVEHAEWAHNVHDADLLRDPQAAESQASTWQNRSMLVNAIKTDDILDLDVNAAQGVFKKPDLGGEVSLRNLRIQEIKYGSIADLLLYSEEGISADSPRDLRDPLIRTAFSIARAQARLYQERLVSFYSDLQHPPVSPFCQPSDDFQGTEEVSAHGIHSSPNDNGNGHMIQDLPDEAEGQAYSTDDVLVQLRDREQWQNDHLRERPIMYNVVVIKESFAEIQQLYPELVGIDANGVTQPARDLWLKEAEESIKLAGASELGENIWLGNGWDDPFRYSGKIRNPLNVDLVIEAHDLADIPTETTAHTLKQVLARRVKPKRSLRHPIASSRSQHLPPDDEPIYLEIASSSRARQCMQNSHEILANRLIALVDAIYALNNPRGTKASPVRTLVFCDDGYTETSVFALTYLMVSRKLSLKEAYLHLQLACKRSFFVYQFDVPFLSVVEHKLATRNVAFKNSAAVRPSSPLSKWKTFGLSNGKNVSMEKKSDSHLTESSVVKPADSWINSDKFDDLGITHVVSVGETLSAEGTIVQGHYISVSGLSAHVGEVQDSLVDTPIKV